MRLEDPRDSEKRFFRSADRLVCQNGAWYFAAREGDMGPFKSREAAEEAMEFFTCEKNDLHAFQVSRELFAASHKGLPLPQVRRGF